MGLLIGLHGRICDGSMYILASNAWKTLKTDKHNAIIKAIGRILTV